MKSLTLTLSVLALFGAANVALATPGAGMGTMAHGPAPTSPSFTAPTNPNTRSGKALGQPNMSCQSIVAAGGSEPGNASSSPGSPFNEPTTNSLGGNGGQHYAGNVPQSSKNTASVSQYDVACSNQK